MVELGLGFQSSQVVKASSLLKASIQNEHKIVLAFTGNIISTGLREYICRLVKDDKVAAIVTNGAGIEEDLIKTFGSYRSTEFDADFEKLIEDQQYRIGNLSVAYELYNKFEEFLDEHFEGAISDSSCDQTPGGVSKLLGKATKSVESYLYWAHKNNTPVFCPTFHDGAIGDFLHDYRIQNPAYRLDFILENVNLSKLICSFDTCGVLILGGGTSKHFTLNNSIIRGGFDWSVVISTATSYDGSDSGGNASEAKTWGKIKPTGESVHIFAEATLVFPQLAEIILAEKL
ncbi:deoxyhypusine synthase family protein [Pseudoalteromonas maricaloris]|uniref:deoxyhypusine synthase family protein n=1 Tax=Pseudoalteromonas maricaloris TaxID=184924 RepID=UPI003C143D33